MAGADNRWWGPRSEFPWEEDALKHIREQVPAAEPYRGWQLLTFTARSGHVREVDLFIATPAGLLLIEAKAHPGRAANQGSTWLFRGRDRLLTIENPLHLTDRKSKELRAQLQWAADKLGVRTKIPFIQPAVFLSAPDLRCEFDQVQRTLVFGRDGLEQQTGLPGIWKDLLGRPPRTPANRVDASLSRQLPKLLEKIGIQGLSKYRRLGPFKLQTRAFDTGPTWEDYLAENTALPGDQPRRIRIYLSELNAPKEQRESARRAARREYLALQGIAHEGIVRAEQFSDQHEAGPAIIFRHGQNWRRLDHFMAERGAGLPVETRVEMVRQLAEALDHAHRRHLYHRAVAARSVYVEMDGRYPRLRICDWQVAARPANGSSPHTATPTGRATSLAAHIEASAAPYLAPEFGNPESDSTLLDIFGLGALTHLILTGSPPAGSRKELVSRLGAERALVPSAVSDEISPTMDDLVRGATAVQPVDRFESVREFLQYLDLVEEELTRPDEDEIPDLLTVTKGATVLDGWKVERVLGKGSTARALLVARDGREQVLKIALNEDGRTRLAHEASQLRDLHDSHVVQLLDGPLAVGKRTFLVLERAGEQTLGQHLRSQGRLTIDELEALGEQLFQALDYMESKDVWHRDIKPDNLAIREPPKKARRLVLFDFSLAGTPSRATGVGTQHYLDPFIGTDRRGSYDAAAEHYAAAVTLHEMASGELPSWGDGMVDPKLLDPTEELPQLAEDSFDPTLRDRLVAFFTIALHRDATKRHPSLRDMSRAWSDIFRNLDETRPATTAHTVHEAPATPAEARDVSAARVEAGTLLVAAGLSARALSTALTQLEVSTVGELIKIPAARIQRLRGVGLGPRNELIKRAREWRHQLQIAEQAPRPAATGPEPVDPATLSLDEAASRLVPKDTARNNTEVRVIRLFLALPDSEGHPAPVPTWAPQATVATETGLDQAYVGDLIAKARERWIKSVPAVTALRKTVIDLLTQHGRVMEAGQLAAALLAERGCGLDDSTARRAIAHACLRAAIETERHLENPRLEFRRPASGKVLIASVAEGDPTAPTEAELLDYATALGEKADELVDLGESAPLPGATTVRQALADLPRPDGMAQLSDTDLITLAVGASRDAAMTARLELYPRSLSPAKALQLAQAASYVSKEGINPEALRARVLARFPELTGLPAEPGELRRLLQRMGHRVEVAFDHDGQTLYVNPGATLVGSWGSTKGLSSWAQLTQTSPNAEAWLRLQSAAERGGFVAIKTSLQETTAVMNEVAVLPNVTPVHGTNMFLAILRETVSQRGKPRWETVLAADSPDAAPNARSGFARLLDLVWEQMDARVREASGVVLLHDATPLARYAGGMDLLARLAAAARRADEGPHGLWLACPMHDPRKPALLDDQTVGALGENEQLVARPGVTARTERRAS